MNIFYLHRNPYKAARDLTDRHVLKMGIESAQMLCNIYWLNGVEAPYKPTHINHPSSVWVRKSRENFNWLLDHATAILLEYASRYSGKVHKTGLTISWILDNMPNDEWFDGEGFTDPPKCMPEQYKEGTTIEAYKRYYIEDKIKVKNLNWNRRPGGVPFWAEEIDSV